MSFSFLHSLSVTRSQKMCASFTPVSQWGQYPSAPGAWSDELLFSLSQKMVPSLRTLPQRSKGMGDVSFSPLPACQCAVCLPVCHASPSVLCFSQCGERTQRCCAQGCCIPPPSRWWSFCLGPASAPGGAAMPVCPAARAVPRVRLAQFVLLLSVRESRRQTVTSCVAVLVIPAYSTGSPTHPLV